MLLRLSEVTDETAFGDKAVGLSRAIRAGLPVPPGVALSSTLVDQIAAGDAAAVSVVLNSPDLPRGRLAVRSSAIGDDPAIANAASQHTTCLNVAPAGIPAAVYVVWESARLDPVFIRQGSIGGVPAVGAVIQQLIDPVAAGVLFTRNPFSGANERLIEAAWGLGEIVTSGQIIPDRYRLDANGRVLERAIGQKDVQIWYDDEEGTSEQPVPPYLWDAACLDDLHLDQLHALADRCQALWPMDLDIDWALGPDGTIYLLQYRPVGVRPGLA